MPEEGINLPRIQAKLMQKQPKAAGVRVALTLPAAATAGRTEVSSLNLSNRVLKLF